jgi:cytosine/adenosine deaminase-related metal-dependent hydrolase
MANKNGIFCSAILAILFAQLVAGCRWSGAQAPAKLIVRNAYIFSMAADQHTPFRGYLVVGEDGKLVAVAAGDPPASLKAATIWNAEGRWVMPGFISAHSHLWQSAYRGLASDQTLLGWIDALYGKAVKQASAEDLYWFTLEGGLDHLRHGITATYSFNYGGHSRNQGEAFNEQEFHGEADSGVRFVHGWEPGRAGPMYTAEVADRELGSFLGWTEKQPKTKLLSVMINGGTAFDETYQQAVLEAALMKHYKVSNQSHYLEQPETQVADREMFKWFTDSGLLTDKMIFGHFIHTDAAILAATGQAHAAMSWNPLSNGRLASGVADIPQYLKAGIRVGMGVDGEASADLADPFENMRTGLYAIRDKYENAGVMSPYDVLRLHTMGSADVLGVADKLGSLETGKMADFLVIDSRVFGHVYDPYATLVFVTSQPDLERVYVGGELAVERGVPLKQDMMKVQREVDRRVALHDKGATN